MAKPRSEAALKIEQAFPLLLAAEELACTSASRDRTREARMRAIDASNVEQSEQLRLERQKEEAALRPKSPKTERKDRPFNSILTFLYLFHTIILTIVYSLTRRRRVWARPLAK